ncbi:hypothetical protein VTK26DRAFT_9253 [Humicola hyalothermophila]
MIAFARTLAGCWLLASAAAALAHEGLVAVETGVILSPRDYQVSPAHALEKRQGSCRAGTHPCTGIGPNGDNVCCENTEYCIVDPDTGETGCCRLGSTCRSECREDTYFCGVTTLTITSGSSSTTTSVSTSCCGRPCSATSYQCPEAFGHGCCSIGFSCGPSICLSAVTPTSSVSRSIAPPGCTTGQISCASSLGGGCCAATQSCTLYGTAPRCAEVTPTGSDISVVRQDSGLSAGAIGGIAAGVVVGCALVIGALTWWFLRRRRERRSEAGGGGGGGGASSRRSGPNGTLPQVVGGGPGRGVGSGREMSDEASDMMSRSGRGGYARDYFGPQPAIGPYSETYGGSPVTTPGLDRERGGVPLQPHGPADIAAPVEIDSRVGSPRTQRALSGAMNASTAASYPPSQNGQEWYELYGSEPAQLSPQFPGPQDGRGG